MKRLLTLALASALAVSLCACGTKTDIPKGEEPPHVMTVVDYTSDYTIYRHDKTGVLYFCYFCQDAAYGKSVCVMLSPDGTPYVEEAEP